MRSARWNQLRASAGRSRQRSIIARWKNLAASDGPQPKSTTGVGQSLVAAPVADERPGQHVVGLDARSRLLSSAGTLERLAEPDAVVDVEEGELEIRLDAVGDEEAVDRAYEPVLLTGEPGSSGGPVEVSERADVLRQRRPLDGPSLELDRSAESSTGGLDVCQCVERLHVAGVTQRAHADTPPRPVPIVPGEVELA